MACPYISGTRHSERSEESASSVFKDLRDSLSSRHVGTPRNDGISEFFSNLLEPMVKGHVVMAAAKRLRLCAVGLGRMGRLRMAHLTSLTDWLELVGVCDSRLEARQEVGARFGVREYADFVDMVEREHPDAVIISTPSATHASYIGQAASRRIHIFCEKPLALTSEDAGQAARAVAEGGVLFQIGFQRHFDRAYREAWRTIRSGQVGTPLTFKSVARDNWRPHLEFARPEVSGGLLMDMAIHDFDLARWLMGSEVTQVSALGSNLLYPELSSVGDFDNAVVNLGFQSGAVGNVEASRTGVYGCDIRTEVVCTQGTLFIGQTEDSSHATATRDGFRRVAVASGFEGRFLDSFVSELREFANCVLEGRAPECGIRDGTLSLEIALAAIESVHQGSPVKVQRSGLGDTLPQRQL